MECDLACQAVYGRLRAVEISYVGYKMGIKFVVGADNGYSKRPLAVSAAACQGHLVHARDAARVEVVQKEVAVSASKPMIGDPCVAVSLIVVLHPRFRELHGRRRRRPGRIIARRGGYDRAVSDVWGIISLLCRTGIDHDGLYWIAESQAGYFTAEQAARRGHGQEHGAPPCPARRPLRARAPRPLSAASLPFEPARARRRRLACPAELGSRLARERARAVRPLRRDTERRPHHAPPGEARAQRPASQRSLPHAPQHPPGRTRSAASPESRRQAPSARSSTPLKPAHSRSRSSSLSAKRFNGA